MGAVYTVISKMKKPFISLIGVSILGAVAHNLTQISLVYLLIVKHTGVFMLLPWLGISGVIMGWVTGVVASRVCEKLEEEPQAGLIGYEIVLSEGAETGKNFNKRYIPGKSFLHDLQPELKIAAVVFMAVIIFALNNIYSYLGLLCGLLIVSMTANIAFKELFSGVKKMTFFILFSFAMPVLFSGNGEVLYALGPLKITQAGLSAGILFSFRLILLMISTDLMIRTTKSESLLKGIESILKPFKFAGISGSRVSSIIVTSWMSIPEFWDKAMVLVNKYRKEEKIGFKSAVVVIAAIILSLYRQTEI
jgi:energy-coupling factor transporter transmembrane protein EcfT